MLAEPERLQKAMARAGVASRRKCEELIAAGRVRVNGAIVREMGLRVQLGVDRIEVDGTPLVAAAAFAYYVLYKPTGYLSTMGDPHGGKLAADLAPQGARMYPVGRLDRDSEGLLLFTNDGDLALRLTHPRYGHTKEYRVLIQGELTSAEAEQLSQGMALEGKARPARAAVKRLGSGWAWRGEPAPSGACWIGLTLREGHKRQIREMLGALGIPVLRLIRVRLASLALGDLEPGQGRMLSDNEVRELRALVGLGPDSAQPGASPDLGTRGSDA